MILCNGLLPEAANAHHPGRLIGLRSGRSKGGMMRLERRQGVPTGWIPVFFALSIAWTAALSAAPNFVEVTLRYTPEASECISVNPPAATVYWDQKPRRVRWVTASEERLFWEIEWKGTEASGGQPDYFGGGVAIGRDARSADSSQPKRRGRMTPGASWPYLIRVYETSPSIARGRLLCELDPVIDWGD
jgi:hypothetical protein